MIAQVGGVSENKDVLQVLLGSSSSDWAQPRKVQSKATDSGLNTLYASFWHRIVAISREAGNTLATLLPPLLANDDRATQLAAIEALGGLLRSLSGKDALEARKLWFEATNALGPHDSP